MKIEEIDHRDPDIVTRLRTSEQGAVINFSLYVARNGIGNEMTIHGDKEYFHKIGKFLTEL